MDLNLLSMDTIVLSLILSSDYFNPNFEKLYLYNES